MNQLTLRGFDDDTLRAIQRVAEREGISLNRAALKLLRRGIESTERGSREKRKIGNALDAFVGTWTEEDAREFREVTRDHDRIDESMWK